MNDKFIIYDATDIVVIGGFGNLDGNLGLLKYNNEEIKQMIKENNNGNDNIRLIESLLNSLKELDQKNQELKKQFEVGEQQYNDLVEEKEKLKEQLDYLRSGEYLNQLKFERDMLQDVVDNSEVSTEDKEFIDMTHRNTQLLKHQKEFIEWLEDQLNIYDGFLDAIKSDLEEISYAGRVSGKTYIATQIMKNETAKKCYEEALSKYKEIIGEKMREIKFRGKNSFQNNWFYGFLTKEKNKYYITEDSTDFYQIDENTIGQFTGLYDKYNVPIYEGDIVEYVYTGEGGDKGDYKVKQGVMNFKKNGWHINSRWLDGFTMRMFQFEVIGNIYDKEE